MTRRNLRPRVLFLGSTYAGWKTRQLNIEAHTRADGRIDPIYRQVTGWHEGGLIERLPAPRGFRGRARAVIEARSFASIPRPDVIWTSCGELVVPYLWAQAGPLRRPVVLETDWSFEQQESMARLYFNREPRRGPRRMLSELSERALFSQVSLFTPISNWAADGLRRAGVEDARIRVLHPGVDLSLWKPLPRRVHEGPLKLLFVGGDFARKGGHILLQVMRERFARDCVLDVVTREDVPETPGVTVHRCEPNSPDLVRLYQEADLFVMPTRAECFGHVSVEAMASGLPVIVGDVGGARDIVDPGETGWLVRPEAGALAEALAAALASRYILPEMGARARRVAEERFDGVRNDQVLVELILEQAARHRLPRSLREVHA
ncbi:MAG: glycosyltransferase [Dehalococcoidia bacterium]|nr:glycosyltransferase [Dehalococcoidia bacterium]